VKILKVVIIPKHKETQIAKIVCDICGEEREQYEDWRNDPHKDDHNSSYFDTETKLEYTFGDNYPDGGSGKKYELDICPKCFMEKIVALTNVKPEDYDY